MMKRDTVISTWIFIMLSLNSFEGIRTLTVTKTDGICKEYPHTKAKIIIKFREENGDTFVDQSMNVTKEFASFGTMILISERCPSRESLSFCENLRNVTIPHFGFLMDNPNNPWSKGFSYTPPLGHPVKPGLYRMNTKKLDAKWSIIKSKGYWRTKAVMMEEGTNDVVFCMTAEGEIR